jgi:hypothetical protein
MSRSVEFVAAGELRLPGWRLAGDMRDGIVKRVAVTMFPVQRDRLAECFGKSSPSNFGSGLTQQWS